MAKSNASPELLSLAQRLQDPEFRRRDVSGWPGDLLGLLGEIESAGEVDVFPQILALILDEDQAVAAMASRAIGGVLARLAPAEVAKLDSIVRDRGIYLPWDQHGWYRLSHEVLDRHLDSGGFPPSFAGLASLHHSGYVRQAALRRLAESRDGSEVPYLLLRVNDWVSPVREAARAALWERLQPEYAWQLVRNLPLVTRLSRCGRDDHSPFVAAVFDLLRTPDARPAVREGLSSTDREVRRACFDLVIEATDIPLLDLLERLIQHDDPILRLRAVRVARVRLEPQDYLNLVEIMRADRFMPVRRETLLGLFERCPVMAEDASMSSLLDPHISVREVAHHYLRKVGGFDLAEFYRSGLRSFADDPARLAVTIAGLGETGVREDAGLVLPFLTHPASKVRRSAVRALSRLDGDSRVGEFLSALKDDRASVSRQAREVLRVRLPLVAGWRLWEMFDRDQRLHVRRNALALISGLGKWVRLPYLIDACSDGDPEIAARALLSIRDWITQFNRSFA